MVRTGGSVNDAYDVEIMVRELTEYELNFLDFPTVIRMVKEQIRKRYDNMQYPELVEAYKGVFNWPETEDMKDVL
jgi:hypothetical protein